MEADVAVHALVLLEREGRGEEESVRDVVRDKNGITAPLAPVRERLMHPPAEEQQMGETRHLWWIQLNGQKTKRCILLRVLF